MGDPSGELVLRWAHSNPVGLLFSSYNGLLTTTSLLYPAVAVLLLLPVWPAHRRLWPLTLLFLASLYVNGAVWDWWGEASFSARRLTDLACPFAVATAMAVAALSVSQSARRDARTAMGAIGLVALGALWNQGAMTSEATGRTRQLGARPAPERWTPIADRTGRMLWQRAGNPLAWPASLPFALWHHVHPRAFDCWWAKASSAASTTGSRWSRDRCVPVRRTRTPTSPEGFSRRGQGGRVLRGRGRVLLPLFEDDLGAIEVEAVAPLPSSLRLRWNGTPLPVLAFSQGSSTTACPLPAGTARVGVNEVVFQAAGPIQLRSCASSRAGDHWTTKVPPDQVRPGLVWGGVSLPKSCALLMASVLVPAASGLKMSRTRTWEPLTFTPLPAPIREIPTVTTPEPALPSCTLTCVPPEASTDPWEDAPA
jgi:hypothetical protein